MSSKSPFAAFVKREAWRQVAEMVAAETCIKNPDITIHFARLDQGRIDSDGYIRLIDHRLTVVDGFERPLSKVRATLIPRTGQRTFALEAMLGKIMQSPCILDIGADGILFAQGVRLIKIPHLNRDGSMGWRHVAKRASL